MSKKKKTTKKIPKMPPYPPIRWTARKFNRLGPLISVIWVQGERVKINRYSPREVVVGWDVPALPNREGVTAHYQGVRITSESPISITFRSAKVLLTDKGKAG